MKSGSNAWKQAASISGPSPPPAVFSRHSRAAVALLVVERGERLRAVKGGEEQVGQVHDFTGRQRPDVHRLDIAHGLQVEDGAVALRPGAEIGPTVDVFVLVGGVPRQTVELVEGQVQLNEMKVVVGHEISSGCMVGMVVAGAGRRSGSRGTGVAAQSRRQAGVRSAPSRAMR